MLNTIKSSVLNKSSSQREKTYSTESQDKIIELTKNFEFVFKSHGWSSWVYLRNEEQDSILGQFAVEFLKCFPTKTSLFGGHIVSRAEYYGLVSVFTQIHERIPANNVELYSSFGDGFNKKFNRGEYQFHREKCDAYLSEIKKRGRVNDETDNQSYDLAQIFKTEIYSRAYSDEQRFGYAIRQKKTCGDFYQGHINNGKTQDMAERQAKKDLLSHVKRLNNIQHTQLLNLDADPIIVTLEDKYVRGLRVEEGSLSSTLGEPSVCYTLSNIDKDQKICTLSVIFPDQDPKLTEPEKEFLAASIELKFSDDNKVSIAEKDICKVLNEFFGIKGIHSEKAFEVLATIIETDPKKCAIFRGVQPKVSYETSTAKPPTGNRIRDRIDTNNNREDSREIVIAHHITSSHITDGNTMYPEESRLRITEEQIQGIPQDIDVMIKVLRQHQPKLIFTTCVMGKARSAAKALHIYALLNNEEQATKFLSAQGITPNFEVSLLYTQIAILMGHKQPDWLFDKLNNVLEIM